MDSVRAPVAPQGEIPSVYMAITVYMAIIEVQVGFNGFFISVQSYYRM